MKATGAEIWDFYKNGWPADHYYDDYSILICDEEADSSKCLLELDKEYDLIDFGYIASNSGSFNDSRGFEEVYLEWKETHNDYVVVAIKVKKSELELVKQNFEVL